MNDQNKSNKTIKILVNLISLLLIGVGAFLLIQRFVLEPKDAAPSIAQEVPTPPKPEEIKKRSFQVDETGLELTKVMKRNGFNMGFLWSGFYKDLGFELPVTTTNQYRDAKDEQEYKSLGLPVPLEELVPAPENPTTRNKIVWPQYEIDAPIIYSGFEDIFVKDASGKFNFSEFVNNDPVDSPVQTKLKDGVVHLPFTPSPGEVGNSYIIGHSSNYSFVNSDYNLVFANIINKVQKDEEFTIFDNQGRELKFKVIDTKALKEADVDAAYTKFEEKRTVSLQGSILEQTPEGILPTKRYIVVAELQTPEVIDSSNATTVN
jgi:Sortase domain